MQSNYNADKALGYRQFTAGSIDTAKLLSLIPGGIPAGACMALIQCEEQAVRWRDDGVAPTTSVGYPLPAGGELAYTSGSFPRLQFISQTAGAVLNVAFYG